jgi:hypothetical protein
MKSVHLASWAGLAVLVAASASLADEATVWIGRTGAQQLKAHAHFAMPFEVHLSAFPALEGFATGDIGWHNAEMDEPGEDMYMLAQACDIRVTLAAIDPGLRVWFGLTELQAGQAMAFGSPFFDFHPIVQIPDHDAEPGTIFSATFVVQDASGLYSASEVLTLQFTPEAHVHCDGEAARVKAQCRAHGRDGCAVFVVERRHYGPQYRTRHLQLPHQAPLHRHQRRIFLYQKTRRLHRPA